MVSQVLSNVNNTTTNISLGAKREISSDVSMCDILVDGEQTPFRFGKTITVNRDTDLRNNPTYKIVSLRFRIPEEIAASLEDIEKRVSAEVGEDDWLCTPNLVDRYNPTRPSLEVRLEVDRNTGSLKTLVFDSNDKLQNVPGSRWTYDSLYEFLGSRSDVEAKISLEIVFSPQKHSFKILAKAKALQIRPQVERKAVEASLEECAEKPFQFSNFQTIGGTVAADIYNENFEIDSGALLNPSLQKVHESITILRTTLLTPAQKAYFENLDEFLRKNAQTAVEQYCGGSPVQLDFFPITSGNQEVQFRFDTKRTTIVNEDGTSVSDFGETNRVKIVFTPELQVSLQRGRYNAVLRAKQIVLLSPMLTPLETWTEGSVTVGSAAPAGFNGNHYGSLYDGKTQDPLCFVGEFQNPDLRNVTGSLNILRARIKSVEQVNAIKGLEKYVEALKPKEAKYFSPLREDDSVVEFTISSGYGGDVYGTINKTNNIRVQFTVDYSHSPDKERWQTILRTRKVEALGLIPFTLPNDVSEGDIGITEPRSVGESGTYYGSFLYKGSPLILDVGHMILGGRQTFGETLDIIRCYPVDYEAVSAAFTQCDEVIRKEVGRIAETTGCGEAAYFPIIRQQGQLEVRIDPRRTHYTKQTLEEYETNNAKMVVSIDYSVQPSKNRIQPILKAKYIEVLPRDDSLKIPKTTSGSGGSGSVSVANFTGFSEGEVTFERPSEEQTGRQKYVLLRYKERPQTFQLEDIVLEKEGNQSVGLPPPEFDSNKVTVLLKGKNLEFFQALDEEISSRIKEFREFYDVTGKSKLAYTPIVNEDNDVPSCKFTFELPDAESNKTPTAFTMGGTPLPINNIEDLRPNIRLGTTLEKPVISISKVWHDKMKKEYSVKIKLNSVGIIPRNVTVSGFDN